jgi:hypothetical protein
MPELVDDVAIIVTPLPDSAAAVQDWFDMVIVVHVLPELFDVYNHEAPVATLLSPASNTDPSLDDDIQDQTLNPAPIDGIHVFPESLEQYI